MRRREFILQLAASATVWPLAANAQQHMRRVAALIGIGNDALGQSWIAAFQQKLRDLGWSDGRDIQIEVIWGGGDIEAHPSECGGSGKREAGRYSGLFRSCFE